MTLNLMLASRHAVYLSGDFRLSRGRTYGDNLNTQKLIPITRFGWGALVAYTGLASYRGIVNDMGAWIASQMNGIRMDEGAGELSERLLRAGTLLDRVPGGAPLAITIVGFVGRNPFTTLISNFTDPNGTVTPLRKQLDRFHLKPKEPLVRVTGDTDAVLSGERAILLDLLRRSADPQEVRRQLAATNVAAAQRSACNSISSQCVTGFLLPSGAAEIGPHGIGDLSGYMPQFVVDSLAAQGVTGFVAKKDEHGNDLAPGWVGTTARIQGSGSDALVGSIHTIRNVQSTIKEGETKSGWALFEKIAGPNEPDRFEFKRAPVKSESQL